MKVVISTTAVALAAATLAVAPIAAASNPLAPVRITNASAIAGIRSGHLPGGQQAVPTKWRPYMLRIYQSSPYRVPALGLFYALGASLAHFDRAKYRPLVLIGEQGLEDSLAAQVKEPRTVTRFGVTVRQYAQATARGIMLGLIE